MSKNTVSQLLYVMKQAGVVKVSGEIHEYHYSVVPMSESEVTERVREIINENASQRRLKAKLSKNVVPVPSAAAAQPVPVAPQPVASPPAQPEAQPTAPEGFSPEKFCEGLTLKQCRAVHQWLDSQLK